jgi:hypothetical protein
VKQHRGNRNQKQYQCYDHPPFLAVDGCELKGGAHTCFDGLLQSAIG